MMTSCTYKFIPSSMINLPTQSYELGIRQQPQRAKMSVINERDRRPIEPPPILQVHWVDCSTDDIKKNLQCPFYFMVANLLSADSNELLSTQDYLAGSTVSSLHRLRDIDDSDGGFFVFGDLFCKKEGHYRLQFNLFEIVDGDVQNRQVITSESFQTYMPKHYPGPVEATFLSRAFSDQGLKMRIRKEHKVSSKSARKRRLDVQALMDSQNESTPPMKATKVSLAAPGHLTATTDLPQKIAPAATVVNEQLYQHNQSSYHHHQPLNTKVVTPTSALSNKDHHVLAAHAYPSPPLLPTNPTTLLNEYHLQSQFNNTSTFRHPSPNSSSSSSQRYDDPITPPPSTCFYPSDNGTHFLPHHVWGERLPVLKAVMSGYTSRSIPLVLPCPFENI